MGIWLLGLCILVALNLSNTIDSLLHITSGLLLPGWLGWVIVLGVGAWLLGDR